MEEKDMHESHDHGSEESPTEQEKQEKREALRGADRIDTLRERLYARGDTPGGRERHPLREEHVTPEIHHPGPQSHEQAHHAGHDMQDIHARTEQQVAGIPNMGGAPETAVPTTPTMPKKKKSYRLKIILAGIVFFVAALGLSSAFLFFGHNTISGDNITIDIADPPLAVGGGQEMTMQVAISNQNTVPIESATLIIDYPTGTQSADEPRRQLFTERQQLNNIGANQVVNVPVKAVFFGEENEEKTVNVSVEYRVQGSNATFYKEAKPWRFKITSSPVALTVDTVKSISSGQEATFNLTVSSNSPTPLKNVLVKASYPSQFDFDTSDPSTVSGQDTWLISELDPNQKETIKVSGIVTGQKNETRLFTFSVGAANQDNQYDLSSVYMKTTAEMTIEEPFLGVDVSVNNSSDDPVTINTGEQANVQIDFTNTLEDTLYDGKIKAELSGSALDGVDVHVDNGGFYDSNSKTISWDSVDNNDLKEIAPSRTSSVRFTLQPKSSIGKTPEIKLNVTVKGQRVFEDKVPQELVGTASRSIRVASAISLSSSALYSEGPFVNTGPVPPKAETVTQYTYLFAVRNGSNDVTGAQMTAVLPPYVTWLDLVTPGDDVTYNSETRTLTWNIGDIEAGGYEEAWIQVSFLPSASQVGTTPTLLETQRFKATDRFTGTTLRSEAPPLTTALINDPNEKAHDGTVGSK